MADDVKIIIRAINKASGVFGEVTKDLQDMRNKMLTASSLEAQKVKELAQAHSQATAENERHNEARKDFLGRTLDKIARAEGKSFEESTAFIEQNRKALNALKADLLVTVGVLAAFGVAVKQAYDFGKEGAQLERLRETGSALASTFGVDMTEAVQKIKAASLDTITTQQAILETNRALLLGVAADTDTLASLMQVAALRGRALGIDTTTAFDRITLGIGRLSTRILDDLGIVVDGETAYAKFGASIGKTADELTEAEKRTALTNAILEESNRLLKETGGLVEDTATKFERLETHITDAGNALKEKFNPFVANAVQGLDIFLFGGAQINAALATQSRVVLDTAKTYSEYQTELIRSAEVSGRLTDAEGNLYDSRGLLIQRNYILTESEFAATRMRDGHTAAIEANERAIEQAAAAEAAAAEAARKLKEAIEEVNKNLDDLTGNFEDFSNADFAAIAIQQAGVLGQNLEELRLAFGLLDPAVEAFGEAIKKAGEDGVISVKEIAKAIDEIRTKFGDPRLRELNKQLMADIADVRAEANKRLKDLQTDFYRDELNDAIDHKRDLDDLNTDVANKREDIEVDHAHRLEDIEEDHQRQIKRILDKFNRARLKAIIDRDARALFEAEQARDQEIDDAKDDLATKRKDEQEAYDDRMDDLKKWEERQRREIEQDYQRQRDDAQRAFDDRQTDIEADRDERIRILQDDFDDQKAIIDEENDKIKDLYREAYDKRLEDFLNYIQSNANAIEALKSGQLTIEDLIAEFEQLGGIPFDVGPFLPPDENPPPPPGGGGGGPGNCPPGTVWDPIDEFCVPVVGGSMVTGTPTPAGTPTGRMEVTLNVVGDGILAQALRSATYTAVADVFAD